MVIMMISLDVIKCLVLNDLCFDYVENDLIEIKKCFRYIRKMRFIGKIIGKLKYCFCFCCYIYIFIVVFFLKCSFVFFVGMM